MSVVACGQNEICRDECPECGGWLHVERQGGFPAAYGWLFCSEDCIAGQQERVAAQTVTTHLHQRDLLCDCALCAAHGLPTQAMRDEYAAYLAGDLS